MKKIIIAAVISLLLSSSGAMAGHGGQHVVVGLNGLVCDYCAQSMKKIFGKNTAVSDVRVDLTAKTMSLDLHPGKELGDDVIRSGVTDAGYSVTGITRD